MSSLSPYFKNFRFPDPQSHKGQNGKLMIIGGSELFHAASKWSLDIASHFVDMVFYSSVPLNNDLVKIAKGEFWNGIVVPREEIPAYIDEADCILIGPGMTRSENTAQITNALLAQYQNKRWVIDAGSLQMIDENLLNNQCILTPHRGEWQRFLPDELKEYSDEENRNVSEVEVKEIFMKTPVVQQKGVTVVLKGSTDYVFTKDLFVPIEGGNPGMTKGGTGDVLAGLIAALTCTQDLLTSAVLGSYVNKKAGDVLYKSVGPYFNTSELVSEIPRTLWSELKKAQ